MARSHGEVDAAEVEEGVGGGHLLVLVEQLLQARDVVGERRLEGVVEQVLDGERLREVGPGCLARAGAVVEVDVALPDDDVGGLFVGT